MAFIVFIKKALSFDRAFSFFNYYLLAVLLDELYLLFLYVSFYWLFLALQHVCYVFFRNHNLQRLAFDVPFYVMLLVAVNVVELDAELHRSDAPRHMLQ